VPWSALTDRQIDFIESRFLPAGRTLKDPSKLQMAEADQLLQFWYDRQKNKLRPTFQFKAWQNQDKEMEDPVDPDEDSDTGRSSGKKRAAGKKIARVDEESSSEAHQEEEEGADYGYDHDDEDEAEDLTLSPPRPEYSRKRGGVEQVEQQSEPEHLDAPPAAKKSKPAPVKKGRMEPVEPELQEQDCPLLAKKSKQVTSKPGRVQPAAPESDPDQQDTPPPAKKSKQATSKRRRIESVEPESAPEEHDSPPAKKSKKATGKSVRVEPESDNDQEPAGRTWGPTRVRKLTQKMAQIVAQGSGGKVIGARTKATGGKTK
jgi:hypothetical protein